MGQIHTVGAKTKATRPLHGFRKLLAERIAAPIQARPWGAEQ